MQLEAHTVKILHRHTIYKNMTQCKFGSERIVIAFSTHTLILSLSSILALNGSLITDLPTTNEIANLIPFRQSPPLPRINRHTLGRDWYIG